MTDFNVMLAATVDPMKDPSVFDKLTYPILLSPKLDGIRGHVTSSGVMSRKNILLPNLFLQREFRRHRSADGEFVVGDVTDGDIVYNRSQSGVMTIAGEPDLHYWLFDNTTPLSQNLPFYKRLESVKTYVESCGDPRVHFVEHELVHNLDQLLAAESRFIEQGFEGVCGRSPDGPYKYGRSTLKQGFLWKLKRFEDLEGQVIGFYEQMTNTNEATISGTGHTKRSQCQEGMVPAGTLGGFLVGWEGHKLRVACGVLTHVQRQYIWNNQLKFQSKILKFRHFPHGKKDLLRHPRFVGWRDPMDM